MRGRKMKCVEPGTRYNHLVVQGMGPPTSYGKSSCIFLCDCGTVKVIDRYLVACGNTKSCGCGGRPMRGLFKSHPRLYKIWYDMIDRCQNPNNSSYSNYGARGATVCPEWLGPDGLSTFIIWAEANGYADGLRLDKDMGSAGLELDIYSPATCKFVTHAENMVCRNKHKPGKSKFLGVSSNSSVKSKPWRMVVIHQGKRTFKRFATELEAALYRDDFIRANNLPKRLNFPDSLHA